MNPGSARQAPPASNRPWLARLLAAAVRSGWSSEARVVAARWRARRGHGQQPVFVAWAPNNRDDVTSYSAGMQEAFDRGDAAVGLLLKRRRRRKYSSAARPRRNSLPRDVGRLTCSVHATSRAHRSSSSPLRSSRCGRGRPGEQEDAVVDDESHRLCARTSRVRRGPSPSFLDVCHCMLLGASARCAERHDVVDDIASRPRGYPLRRMN